MTPLKLIALDADDLDIVSAHVQDAVLKVGEIQFDAAHKRLILPMNRFAWEAAKGVVRQHNERRNAVLQFDRVLGVQSAGIERDKPKEILSLLAMGFAADDEPAGTIELLFAGGGAIRVQVECVEARLADLGGAWEASSRPAHKV
ncbi:MULTISPECIES: DUF2948 family protein [Mesorhizobium]|uniref:DUF2948 family protein n=1 Tax=Mesorhizobium denitrificans TaxID=2294114 RepID=A0A371XCX3_9HYPH|nr:MULTISPECIES: DUF2948 family protein [Mesorhizobium]RFC67089.1 DUF2948 family protein [Mesorhizobium denitrificans]